MPSISSTRRIVATCAALAAIFSPALPARADIRKIVQTCQTKPCPVLRATLPIPEGWREDEEAGRRRALQILVPKGETFASASAVIYATVRYNADREATGDFIARAQAKWRERVPDARIERLADIRYARGMEPFRHYRYEAPNALARGFERLATTADTDENGNPFLVVIGLTSLSSEALAEAVPAYLSILRNY